MFNETKTYLYILFGGYWTIKTADYWLALGIGEIWLVLGIGALSLVGLVILLFFGRWDLFKAQKATEFIGQRHGSITGYAGFNMQVRMVELQELILEELKKDKSVTDSNLSDQY